MTIFRRSVIPLWVDTTGRTLEHGLLTQENTPAAAGGAQAVLDAMAAMSGAAMRAVFVNTVIVGEATPVGGPYASVQDKVVFMVRSGAGTTAAISVPGPIAGIFLGSTDRVDMTNALVVSLLGAIFAHLCDSNGNPWTVCYDAYREKTTTGMPLFPET